MAVLYLSRRRRWNVVQWGTAIAIPTRDILGANIRSEGLDACVRK